MLYLKAYNNNRAETVFVVAFEAFMEYAEYKFNERIRSDKDGENIKFAEYMLKTKGTGHGSFIDGCSLHNQRCGNFAAANHYYQCCHQFWLHL